MIYGDTKLCTLVNLKKGIFLIVFYLWSGGIYKYVKNGQVRINKITGTVESYNDSSLEWEK